MAKMQQKPLAERLRPQVLEEIVGQQHLVGPAFFMPEYLLKYLFGDLPEGKPAWEQAC